MGYNFIVTMSSSISSNTEQKKAQQNIVIQLRDEFQTKAQNIVPVLSLPPQERQPRECEMILNLLKKVEIISKTFDFKTAQFKGLIDHLKLDIFLEKSVIFKKGDEGDYFYIVLIGCCAVKPETKSEEHATNQKPQIFYHPGKGFGEISLIYDVPRGATVVAYQNTTLIKISKSYFRKCLKVEKKLSEMNSFFGQHPFLQMADSFILRVFASGSTKIAFRQGDTIVKQGEPINHLIFFMKGSAVVYRRIILRLKNGKIVEQLVEVEKLSENSIFGEQFMVSQKPSNYVVKALDRGEYAKVQLQHNIGSGDTPFSRRILSTSNRSISEEEVYESYICNLYKEVRKIELLMGIYKQKSELTKLQGKLKEAKIKYKEMQEAVLVNQEQETSIY